MSSEDSDAREPSGKLAAADQHDPASSIFAILATGDDRLILACVLQLFGTAACDGPLAHTRADGAEDLLREHRTASLVGAFSALAERWQLSTSEKRELLGVASDAALERLILTPLRLVPLDLLERVSALFTIAQSLGDDAVAVAWIRSVERSQPFEGKSPLDLMMRGGLDGLREVRSYLLRELVRFP